MKTALITGGSGGIGSAVCQSLAQDGWFVNIGYCRKKDEAEQLAARIGGRAVYGDVSRPEDMEALFAAVGGVDLLVYNSGVAHYGLLTDMSYEDWRRLMAVNMDGAFLCCRLAIPHMVRQQAGNIILISSMWGQVGASCEAAYAASKSALIGLGKSIAKELAPSGVRCNCVAPGVIRTPMLDNFSAEELEELRQEIPLERLGTPEDVAALVRFLSSDASGYITGQVLGINGGFVIT